MNHLQKMRMKVNTPENVPRLFDLITVENERLKLAFYATLQNTIVAKDLDQVSGTGPLVNIYPFFILKIKYGLYIFTKGNHFFKISEIYVKILKAWIYWEPTIRTSMTLSHCPSTLH